MPPLSKVREALRVAAESYSVRDDRARAFRERSAMAAEEVDAWKNMFKAGGLTNAQATNAIHEQQRQMERARASREQSAMAAEELNTWKAMFKVEVLASSEARGAASGAIEQSAMAAEEVDMWKNMCKAGELSYAKATDAIHDLQRLHAEMAQGVSERWGENFGDLYLELLDDKSRLRDQRRTLREHIRWLSEMAGWGGHVDFQEVYSMASTDSECGQD